MISVISGNNAKPFPRLRQDLVFGQAPKDTDQSAKYILADLVRHKFFHFGQIEMDELSQAKPITGDPSPLVSFLAHNELTMDNAPGNGATFAQRAKQAKQGIFTAALHGYLFFRIPLFNPEPLQRKLWPFAKLCFTNLFAVLTLLAAMASLFLISRHWAEFTGSFSSMYSVAGLATYALAFAFIKLLHEAGHAFMAYRYRVPVPTVGIAFMMFAPVLYSETSVAWRLPKRERMFIGAGGMIVEVTLAIWASLLWAFVPDGTVRSILFAIATTGWFLTLAVNLNPLMRFDGYFLASDLVSVPNLQDRSFAIARSALREILFAPGEPKPEEFSPAMTTGLVIFAVATWIYRFFLFLGIALLVYHFTVKLLGTFLFLVEIVWFILLPIWREAKHWWKNRINYFSTQRSRKSIIISLFLIALFFLPLARTISTPALLTANQVEQIHAKSDARIRVSHLLEGMPVSAGDALLELDMPDLDFELNKAEAAIQLAKTKLLRLAADAESRSQRNVIEEEMARALQKRDGLMALANNRIIRAPFDGIIVNVETALTRDRWIGPTTMLAVIKSVEGGEIHSLATDVQVNRLDKSAAAVFYPDDLMFPALAATLLEVDGTGSARLPYAELADVNGGQIATIPSDKGETVPTVTYAKLRLAPAATDLKVNHLQRGVVRIAASGESVATKVFRRIAAVLIMESGF
ncbi:MAG: biotin/lipoyl-binding protein [Rhizobiaceae bacterium]